MRTVLTKLKIIEYGPLGGKAEVNHKVVRV